MRDRSHPLELLRQAASERAAAGVRRALVPRGPNLDGRARDGLLDLASNDYLGLCGDERLTAAAAEAARVWGTGSTGSRLVTGALAGQGGAVLGAPEVIATLVDSGRGFIFDTGLAPPCADAAPWPPSRWSRPRAYAFSQAVQGRHTLMSSEGYGTANFCFPAQMRRRGAHGLRGIGRPPETARSRPRRDTRRTRLRPLKVRH